MSSLPLERSAGIIRRSFHYIPAILEIYIYRLDKSHVVDDVNVSEFDDN